MICGDSDWNSNLPLAIISLFVYPIGNSAFAFIATQDCLPHCFVFGNPGIPALFFALLYKNRLRLKEPNVLIAFSVLYEAYDSLYWWWELVRCFLF